jgi:hypothetical protein
MRRMINRERVRKMYQEGATVTAIAAEFACGKPAISKILKSMRGQISKPAPVSITDTRLLYLLQALYQYLWKLKTQDWQNAPKKAVQDRLKMLLNLVKEG